MNVYNLELQAGVEHLTAMVGACAYVYAAGKFADVYQMSFLRNKRKMDKARSECRTTLGGVHACVSRGPSCMGGGCVFTRTRMRVCVRVCLCWCVNDTCKPQEARQRTFALIPQFYMMTRADFLVH